MSALNRNLAHLRLRTHAWLARHPRCAAFLERIGCLAVDRPVIARGIAVGLFVALTPTLGVQTLLMLLFCALVRGNFIAAFTISWVSNPITLGPLYLGYYVLGERVLEGILDPLSPLLNGSLPQGVFELSCLLLGSLLIALPAALLGYLLGSWVGRLLPVRSPG